VALVFPRDLPAGERLTLYRGLALWGRENPVDDDEPRLKVAMGRAGEVMLTQLDDLAPQRTLQAETWCRPSRRWLSVTPVALDRNPGDLRARESDTLGRATREAEGTIRAACTRIDLPEPEAVTVLPAPPVPGAAKGRWFPPFPGDPERPQRVLTHAALEFATPVRGPILLGAGRYLGLGLFRPVDR
jgi:CRISPR-associated protein Csb2